MTTLLKTALTCGVSLLATSTFALGIDFEDFDAGTIVDNEYFSTLGVTVSARGVGFAPDAAVIFDTQNPTGNDDDLGGPFAPGPGNMLGSLSPGNVLILQENDTCDAFTCTNPDDQGARPGGTISFAFEEAVSITSIDFFDVEGPETGTVVFFGATGNILNTLDILSTGGDNLWMRMFMDVGGVYAMDINLGGSGAIDNVQYVPVPAALPMMLGALGVLGLARRRVMSIA